MSKALVKIIVNDKDLCTKKLNLKETLNEIRKKTNMKKIQIY